MSLYCEAFLPDMNLKESEFVRVLTNIAAKLTQQRHAQKVQGGPAVDLRFLLPAGDDKPDFRGMRLHSYSQDCQRLLIESVVPEGFLHSELCTDYILAAMQDAVDNATDFFTEQQVSGFSAADQHRLILSLNAA